MTVAALASKTAGTTGAGGAGAVAVAVGAGWVGDGLCEELFVALFVGLGALLGATAAGLAVRAGVAVTAGLESAGLLDGAIELALAAGV